MHPHATKPAHEIDTAGGAYVRRRFEVNGRERMAGDMLTRAEVAAIPRANLNALINTGRIELWPRAPGAEDDAVRLAVHIGFGRYLVVQGVRLTEEPVSREEAEALVAAAATSQH